MIRPRLLERLRKRAASDGELHSADDTQAVIASIMNHICAIMNTRQGSAQIDPAFGIPDFTGAGVSFTHDDIPRITREMEQFISRYEPRLRNIRIAFRPDNESPLLMSFVLTGELRLDATDGHEGMVLPVQMVTRINTQGKVTVQA
ncbi:MAG: type VI secretion system baseplate subunit TssE [Desulfovibrionaceae bacterium]|nr:type VI secretion system baseplate subunit TssE [Desulfovibrionaceae bacterium]